MTETECDVCQNPFWSAFEIAVTPKSYNYKPYPSFDWKYCPKCGRPLNKYYRSYTPRRAVESTDNLDPLEGMENERANSCQA